jgi:hypothetical protein
LTPRGPGGRVAPERGKRSRSLKPGLAFLSLALVCLLAAPATAPAAPPNDNFADAQVLEGFPVTVTGTNREGTGEEGEPEHGPFRVRSVWYRWTSPVDAPVIVDTCPSDIDTVVAVYTGDSVNALTGVAANDDACGSDGLQSRARFTAVAGVTYHIAVDSVEEDAFTLTVAPPPVPRPGRYSGRADFGERLSFVLSPDGTVISRFTIERLELDCPGGTLNIRRLVLPPFPMRPDGRFKGTIVSRGRGLRQVVKIDGRFSPPARARVTVRVTLSIRGIGTCRYFFGRLSWRVRHTG